MWLLVSIFCETEVTLDLKKPGEVTHLKYKELFRLIFVSVFVSLLCFVDLLSEKSELSEKGNLN